MLSHFFQKIWKLVYRIRIRKEYRRIDRRQYLKRVQKGKWYWDRWYYNEADAEQLRSNEVLVRSSYAGHAVFFQCDPASYIENAIIQNGLFERRLIDLIADVVKPNSVIVDVGANIGAYAIPLARFLPTCSVHAFEPNPLMVERLARNVSLNRLHNVAIHQVGLSDGAGSQVLWTVTEGNQGLSSFLGHAVRGRSTQPVPVRVETLDRVLNECTLPVSVVKIDVQGLELCVLNGGMNVIQKWRPPIVFEYERRNFPSEDEAERVKDELQTLFRRIEYEVYYVSRYGADLLAPVRWGSLSAGDLLALPMKAEHSSDLPLGVQ